ncbi:hypothetical protein [Rhizohabitans arisaemae]|uniref:hypothetical protein n=1 Tax=Rhizohabitans arisaemae TaxID=2720610 RepID=UPI0024B0B55F|nr:hypothetical protein [Rhizohabitans arisaemae]
MPGDQLVHFDAELAGTDISELESMLTRWAVLANDGFEEFLLSAPFEDLDFGGRFYDERPESEVFVCGNEHLDRLLSDPKLAAGIAQVHGAAAEMDRAYTMDLARPATAYVVVGCSGMTPDR